MRTFIRQDVLSWQPCHGKTKTLRIMRGVTAHGPVVILHL